MDTDDCCCENFEAGAVSNCCPVHNFRPLPAAPGCYCVAEDVDQLLGNQVDNHKEIISFLDPDVLFVDGFDDALIGFTNSWGPEQSRCMRTIYDYSKCIDILMHRDGLTHLSAVEHLESNTLCAYMGERTPVFIHIT